MSKIHHHRHAASFERMILKKIPKVILSAVFIPLFMSIFSRLFPVTGTPAEIARYQISVDMLSISLGFIVITAAFTVTIGCIIVVLMRDPAYVTGACDLGDTDRTFKDEKHQKDSSSNN